MLNHDALKPCPFCGHKLEYIEETHTNKDGRTYRMQYFMHPETDPDCILNALCQPFTMGAGDARLDEGYLGEYAEMWNRRIKEEENE